MQNRNLILTVLGIAVALAVGLAVFAALRGRGSVFVGLPDGGGPPSNDIPSGPADGATEGNETELAVCGDGTCTQGESAEVCWSDCVDFGPFGGVEILNLPDGKISVSWRTSRPMTSAVDFGADEGYSLGSVAGEQSVTDHSLEIVGLGSGNFFFRLRGIDAAGVESSLSGLSLER